jgi:YfiR/HmsC-like
MRPNDLPLHGRLRRVGRMSRRRFGLLIALGLAAPLVALPGQAESVTAPIVLQAELLAKVAEYDRNFASRAGDRARVLLVTQPTNADSVTVAQQMSAALGRLSQIAGLPHDETVLPYPGAAELARVCRDRHVSIVYFGPGFRDDVGDIRAALSGVDVLSVASVPDYVKEGVVLGFDVVSGRPKLLFNLPQARLQKVALTATVLKLMTVYE